MNTAESERRAQTGFAVSPVGDQRAAASLERAAITRLRPDDIAAVVRLDARLTGRRKAAYWTHAFAELVEAQRRARTCVGLAARARGRLIGYLLGEVRAFEFGSPPCGWIVAVGVDPDRAHHGIGSALVAGAARRFARAGVGTVRTMVRRDDVAMLAFFRSNGFAGGSFTQLELALASRAPSTHADRAAHNPVRHGRPR
jgi:ribosomal protein S18 acetylase RimI-like enzyme